MSLGIFITKYKAQLQALLPSSEVEYELSEENPIKFTDSANVKLAFACIADTHFSKKEYLAHNVENCFKDIFNSNEKFDALLMAGDIAELGKKGEYKRFFQVFDTYKDKIKLFITMGNHDVRLQYRRNQKIIMNKVNEYLNIDTNRKSYYSYDVNGYTIIVIGTEKRVLEKAYISKEQIEFLRKELERATKDNKPAFVMCHQAFAFTHGLPEVWKTGDMGEQSDEVRKVMEQFKNVFFINGHLHGGVFEKTFEVLNEENGVYSLSVPGYRKPNNFGITDLGVGYTGEVYDDKVIFKARNFVEGKNIESEFAEYIIPLKK